MALVKRAKLAISDYLKLPKMRKRDPETNEEVLSPVPLAPPIGWFKQPSMFDTVRDMVRGEHMRMAALASGNETFEDANDFEVEDDIFPASAYEADFEPLEDLQQRRQAEFERHWRAKREDRRRKREEREWQEEDTPPSPPPSPRKSASGAPARSAEGVSDEDHSTST